MDNLIHQGLQVKNKRGKLSKETPIMMWISCVTTDVERLGQSQDDELDKNAGETKVKDNMPTLACKDKRY